MVASLDGARHDAAVERDTAQAAVALPRSTKAGTRTVPAQSQHAVQSESEETRHVAREPQRARVNGREEENGRMKPTSQ